MRAKSLLASPLFGDDLKKLFPHRGAGGERLRQLRQRIELLLQAGRSLPHANGHADSGSLGRKSAHEAGEAGVL